MSSRAGFRWRAVCAFTAIHCTATAASAKETTSAPAGDADPENFRLPPVPVAEMSKAGKSPSWDTGLLLAVCGVGNEKAWQVTKFCLGGLLDVMFLRKAENETGLGGYAKMSSAGFRDVRASGGVTSILSLLDWFSLSLRGGGMAAMSSGSAQPGFEGFIGVGHRSSSLSSHYALSHSLVGGMQYALPSRGLPASHAIWLGVQIDGIWLTAPVGFFR